MKKKDDERNNKIKSFLDKTKKFFSGGWVESGVVGFASYALAAGGSLYTAGMTDMAFIVGKGLLFYSGIRVASNAASMVKDEALDTLGYLPPAKETKLLPPGKPIKAELVED